MRKSKLFRGALILALLAISACIPAREVTITFGGDVMLARDGVPLFLRDPWGNFAQSMQPGKLFFVNLESPLLDPEVPVSNLANGYDLCAASDQIKWLVKGGVNLVTAENNHQNDCGQDGAEADTNLLKAAKIPVVGGNTNPVIYEEQGGKVGIIAVDAIDKTPDLALLGQSIKDLRPNVDILVVSIHWGSEYQAGVDNVRNELAQFLADSGADVVWGHHPHILQKVDILHSGVTGHDTLVLYSMGNLLSDQYMREDTLRSALVTATFKRGQLVKLQVTPIRMDRVSRGLLKPSAQDTQKILEALNWGAIKGTGVEVIQP